MTPDTLAQLHGRCFDRGWRAQDFETILSQSGTILCHETGGFALARLTLDEAELLTLAVDPAMRQQGIARRLMATLVTRLHERGAKRLFLEVAEDNLAARRLYEAVGFAQDGSRPGYYPRSDRPAVAALLLSKAL